jgi:hypothetical protein
MTVPLPTNLFLITIPQAIHVSSQALQLPSSQYLLRIPQVIHVSSQALPLPSNLYLIRERKKESSKMTGKQTPGTMKPNSHIADMNKDKLHRTYKKFLSV